MHTTIGLLNFTEQGIKTVKETTRRAAAAQAYAEKLGVNMKAIYWTLGRYDLVCVLEAQDEAAITAFNLAVAGQGNLRSESLRAYTAGEMDAILAILP